jgi:hypothetical protein
MRPDETVRVPEQQVDSPYDRPTEPRGIPVTPQPREPEMREPEMREPEPQEPEMREPQSREPELREAEPESESSGPPSESFGDDDVERFRGRWKELQADFVDDPERAVRGADQLVGEVLATITERKRALDEEWHGGDTEQLRVALRRYRSFLDRLLET